MLWNVCERDIVWNLLIGLMNLLCFSFLVFNRFVRLLNFRYKFYYCKLVYDFVLYLMFDFV